MSPLPSPLSHEQSVRVLYRASVPGMFLWVLGGHCMKGATQPARVALYAALDRPVFICMTAFAMYGFFNKIDSECCKAREYLT